ncbi:MAG: glutathione S-transferase [Pseudomonadota bacterium]
MEFYYTPHTCALASHIALREVGAEFTLRRIDFGAEEQKSADFLKVNPKARVPALVTDRGVLTETPAILTYIAQTWPKAGLAPTDPFEHAAMQSLMSYLCSTVHVAHAHRMRGYRWADDPAAHEAMRRKVPEAVSDAWAYVEDEALIGPFAMGETHSVADPYVFTIAQWMEGDGVDMARFPRIAAHREMMRARPAVAAAIAAETDG